jgi:acetolactate synthase-1/2/3 large subunit
MNNSMWGAVCRATLGMYPQGEAPQQQTAADRPRRLPAFEQMCAAAGGYGERVEDPAVLPAALERAVAVEKRQALLNVICGGPYASRKIFRPL